MYGMRLLLFFLIARRLLHLYPLAYIKAVRTPVPSLLLQACMVNFGTYEGGPLQTCKATTFRRDSRTCFMIDGHAGASVGSIIWICNMQAICLLMQVTCTAIRP